MNLKEVLIENGLEYETIVVELDVTINTEARETLMKSQILCTPVIKVGDTFLIRDETFQKDNIRAVMNEIWSPSS